MQQDLHFSALLALCVRAGYSKERAKLIAWASWMTDEWSGTQVKWPWQVFINNPGPFYHFVVQDGEEVVRANSKVVRALVRRAQTDIQLGIALHAFLDSYSHEGFVGRLDAVNEMGLKTSWLRRLIPPYGHVQLLKRPDRAESVWTDTRTGEVKDNRGIFQDCLFETAKLLASKEPGVRLKAIVRQVFDPDYDSRKKTWAKLAGMEGLRFSEIKKEMWAEHGPDFKAAAARQKAFLKA